MLTEQGTAEQGALVYPFLSENYFYYPGAPEETIAAQKHNEEMAKVAVANPAASLFSPAQGEYGATLSQLMTDMYGNRDRSLGHRTAGKIRNQWRERGGDEIRAEYEAIWRIRQLVSQHIAFVSPGLCPGSSSIAIDEA